MNSHIDLAQPSITKIKINEDIHNEEKIKEPEKPIAIDQPTVNQNIVQQSDDVAMPAIKKDVSGKRENIEIMKMSIWLI